MFRITLVTLVTTLAACASDPSEEAVLQQEVTAPAGCKAIAAIARPIAAPQFHDPALQQTAGRLSLRIDRGDVREGTIVATIAGRSADGTLLGNHDVLFPHAGFRTRNDLVVATPTSDPCVFGATTELYVVEGSGPLAGLTGTLHGAGTVDFCGGEGRVAISGFLCAP